MSPKNGTGTPGNSNGNSDRPMDSGSDAPVTRNRWLLENVVSLVLAILLVLMIRSSVIEPFRIPSGSMIPTLLVGDHIFVNKFSYGVILPFTDWLLDEPIYLFRREPPKRGDVIVFRFPRDESIYYIKRVVAVPGDTLEIRNKRIYINGSVIERKPVSEEIRDSIGEDIQDSQYDRASLELHREMFDTADPVIMVDKDNFIGDNYGPVTIPQERYFVMGDNRDFSNDSRFWGFVPLKNVKGKAVLIWFSIWFSPDWSDFSRSEFDFRPGRIGTVLN